MFRPTPDAAPEPCRVALLVLDFDGTLTDADAHAPAFREASANELARRLGWDEPTLRREWRRAQAAVDALPPSAAWIVDGRGVCPAAVDPYVVVNGIVQLLLAAHRTELGSAEVTAGVLDVHRAAYARVPPPFRPDAREALERLCAGGHELRVVSNTSTETVARRLDELAFKGRERVIVHGDAGKFAVCASASGDPRFEALPEAVDWPGVGRAVHLRRGRYFDTLRAVWDGTGTGPETTLVVGDVLELDLAMPAALGAHVHLVTRAGTMDHERRLARSMARGAAAPRLWAVVDRIHG